MTIARWPKIISKVGLNKKNKPPRLYFWYAIFYHLSTRNNKHTVHRVISLCIEARSLTIFSQNSPMNRLLSSCLPLRPALVFAELQITISPCSFFFFRSPIFSVCLVLELMDFQNFFGFVLYCWATAFSCSLRYILIIFSTLFHCFVYFLASGAYIANIFFQMLFYP